MSSIVIAGDSSGSITLDAPAVSGTTVLTLPTTSGTLIVSGGAQTIEFADGTVSAPSITNSGDTNTGIYFPAADTIAFTEGGVESMRIDASGNLGIGTTSPTFAAGGGLNVANGTFATMRARGGSSTGTDFAGGSDGKGYVYVRDNADLLIGTNNTERMRIDSAGAVGIGTSSPGRPFHVSTGVTSYIARFQNTQDSLAVVNFKGSTTGDFTVGIGANGENLVLLTNTTERMRIDSSGNVGIGTSSPVNVGGAKVLTIYDATEPRIQLQNSTTGTASTDGSNIAVAGSDLYFTNRESTGNQLFFTNGSERMRIASTGAVTTPDTATASHSFGVSRVDGVTIAFRNAAASSPYGVNITFTAAAPNNSTNYFLYCSDSAAERATIRSNGGIANYSANNVNISDAREKTNVELAGSYLDKICAIPVKTFNYIDQNIEEDDGLTLGVIAQDVQAVAPELVMESNWAAKDEPEKLRLSIYQTDLQYALMKCIQEQQAIITQLQADVAALKGAK